MYKLAAAKAMKKAAPKSAAPVVVQQQTKQGWWASLTPEQRKLISNIAIGLGISLIAATLIYFAAKRIRKIAAAKKESKSLGEDKHATWAKQIKNAFDNDGWWGTDTAALRKTLREIPSMEDFTKVVSSYKTLTAGEEELISRMTDELRQTEYDEMLAIINSKPKKAKDAKAGAVIYDPHGWAKRLNAAVNYRGGGLFWGTDEDAITAVILEMPTQMAFFDTATAYKQDFGTLLMDDLIGDLSFGEVAEYTRMIKEKPIK
ncbi:MAG: hypothetical protein HYZ14_15315 [Bacteroidetes bacterium]|nr:hypothetical protein [Bacteroidota bacterium]